MQQAPAFMAALKRSLKAKGVTYKDVATHLEISEASVKRLFAAGTLSLSRVGAILDGFDLTFGEIAKIAQPGSRRDYDMLTFEQESVLAADPKLFAFFHLVIFGVPLAKIHEAYTFTAKDTARFVSLLRDLGLIVIQERDRLRPTISRNLKWLDDGPLREVYESRVQAEFLGTKFNGEGELFAFSTLSLSASSQAMAKRRLRRLLQELEEMSAVDTLLPPLQARPAGLLIACRPFAFSAVSDYRKRRGRNS